MKDLAAHAVTDPALVSAPKILLLGSVHVAGAVDALVEPTRRSRLTELAAILAIHPGCDHTTIDAAYYPGQRVEDNTRNTQVSKLRRWLGRDAAGADYLPRYHTAGGYRLHSRVTTDWADFKALLPNGPTNAPTAALSQALALVRGRPFEGVRARRYAWADHLQQVMITAIADAAHELASRHLRAGEWRDAENTAVLGLDIDPIEKLWRLRILAAFGSGNRVAVQEAVARLLVLSEDRGGGLEPATEQLLDQLTARGVISTRLEHPGLGMLSLADIDHVVDASAQIDNEAGR